VVTPTIGRPILKTSAFMLEHPRQHAHSASPTVVMVSAQARGMREATPT
jgi:hypothetical protein